MSHTALPVTPIPYTFYGLMSHVALPQKQQQQQQQQKTQKKPYTLQHSLYSHCRHTLARSKVIFLCCAGSLEHSPV